MNHIFLAVKIILTTIMPPPRIDNIQGTYLKKYMSISKDTITLKYEYGASAAYD